MKKQFLFLLALLISASMIFTSCKKDEETVETTLTPGVVVNTLTLNATAYDKWVYFSFDSSRVVAVDNYLTSDKWDIAFHRYDVRVNCGTSGIGMGGTYNAGKVDFNSATTAPESGYSLNDTIKIYEVNPMQHNTAIEKKVPGDTLLAKWIKKVYGANGPVYSYSDNIYIIKTAKGKYVKFWLKNYCNEKGDYGYVTMKYAYQTYGSRNF